MTTDRRTLAKALNALKRQPENTRALEQLIGLSDELRLEAGRNLLAASREGVKVESALAALVRVTPTLVHSVFHPLTAAFPRGEGDELDKEIVKKERALEIGVAMGDAVGEHLKYVLLFVRNIQRGSSVRSEWITPLLESAAKIVLAAKVAAAKHLTELERFADEDQTWEANRFAALVFRGLKIQSEEERIYRTLERLCSSNDVPTSVEAGLGIYQYKKIPSRAFKQLLRKLLRAVVQGQITDESDPRFQLLITAREITSGMFRDFYLDGLRRELHTPPKTVSKGTPSLILRLIEELLFADESVALDLFDYLKWSRTPQVETAIIAFLAKRASGKNVRHSSGDRAYSRICSMSAVAFRIAAQITPSEKVLQTDDYDALRREDDSRFDLGNHCVAYLSRCLSDDADSNTDCKPDPQMRLDACTIIGNAPGLTSNRTEVLISELENDEDGRVRLAAAKALIRHRKGRDSVEAALQKALSEDPDPAVVEVIRALVA